MHRNQAYYRINKLTKSMYNKEIVFFKSIMRAVSYLSLYPPSTQFFENSNGNNSSNSNKNKH